MAKQQDSEGIAKVMAARAARLGIPPPSPRVNAGPGAVWNTAGLNGHPGNQPMNVWAHSGLPHSVFNAPPTNGQDWRTVVVEYTKKHKEQNGG